MKRALTTILTASLLNACANDQSSGNAASSESSVKKDNDKIRNGIEIQQRGGLEAEQAFLLTDAATLIDESNIVAMGENVNLRLVMKGWRETDGKVQLGASEKVVTSEGDVILDAPNILSSVGEVTVEDAQFVTLKAQVTKLNKLFDYFEVQFRVWDKAPGGGEVTGSYRFKVK